nr:uncharacterized protein LOC108948047 isoform X4 [Nicotiana tomentosiformis]
MPKSYFNDCFNNIVKSHFCFMTIEEVAREYVYRSIVKKWVASRQKLWYEFKDLLKIKDEIMDNVLPSDAASGPVSPTDARRSSGASNLSDNH